MSNNFSVYKHTSPSGKIYIGITSVSPEKRWRKGHGYIHGRPTPFSNAINKYGWDNIKHEILLENISEGEAKYAEKYLIKWYKLHHLSYNVTDGGDIGGSLVGENHPMYGRHETNPMFGIRGSANPNAIKVYQYDREGNYIKSWDSIVEAAATFDNKNSAQTGITACCKHKLPACKGYIWRYFYKERLDEKAPLHTKKVFQYDINGFLLHEYNKINEVQKVLNISKNRLGIISSCCEGKSVSGMGFFWSYKRLDRYPVQNINPSVLTKMRKYLNRTYQRKKEADDVEVKKMQVRKKE